MNLKVFKFQIQEFQSVNSNRLEYNFSHWIAPVIWVQINVILRAWTGRFWKIKKKEEGSLRRILKVKIMSFDTTERFLWSQLKDFCIEWKDTMLFLMSRLKISNCLQFRTGSFVNFDKLFNNNLFGFSDTWSFCVLWIF